VPGSRHARPCSVAQLRYTIRMAKPTAVAKQRKVSVFIPPDIHRKFKLAAVENGMSLSQYIAARAISGNKGKRAR